MLLSHFLNNKRRPNLDTKEIFLFFLSVTCKIWCTQTWHLYSLKIHSSTSYIWVPAVEQPRNSFLLYQPYCAVKNPLSLLRSALEGSTAAGRTAGHKPGQSWQLDKFGGEKASPYHGCRTWRESSNWRSTDSDTWWQESPETVRQTNGNKEGGKKIPILVLKDLWGSR